MTEAFYLNRGDRDNLQAMLRWWRAQGRAIQGILPMMWRGERVERWRGQIVAAGPAEEPDFTDERYWVRRCACTNASTEEKADRDPLTLTQVDEYPDGGAGYAHVAATNLSEWAAGGGTHSLAVGDVVEVFCLSDVAKPNVKPAVKHWFFWRTPRNAYTGDGTWIGSEDGGVKSPTFPGNVIGHNSWDAPNAVDGVSWWAVDLANVLEQPPEEGLYIALPIKYTERLDAKNHGVIVPDTTPGYLAVQGSLPDPPACEDTHIGAVSDGVTTIEDVETITFAAVYGLTVTVTEPVPGSGAVVVTLSGAGMVGDHKVIVSGDDTTPDYLDEKLKSVAGDTDHIAVDIETVGGGGDENLAVKIHKADVRDAAFGESGNLVCAKRIHVTSDGTEGDETVTLDEGDWRGGLVTFQIAGAFGSRGGSEPSVYTAGVDEPPAYMKAGATGFLQLHSPDTGAWYYIDGDDGGKLKFHASWNEISQDYWAVARFVRNGLPAALTTITITAP